MSASELSARTTGALTRAGFPSLGVLKDYIIAHKLCSPDGGKTYMFPGIMKQNAQLPEGATIDQFQHESIPMVGKVGWGEILASLEEDGFPWRDYVHPYKLVRNQVRTLQAKKTLQTDLTRLRSLGQTLTEPDSLASKNVATNRAGRPKPKPLSDAQMAAIRAEFPPPGPTPNLGYYRYVPTVDKPPKPKKWAVRIVAAGYSPEMEFQADSATAGPGGTLILTRDNQPVVILAPGTWVMARDATNPQEED